MPKRPPMRGPMPATAPTWQLLRALAAWCLLPMPAVGCKHPRTPRGAAGSGCAAEKLASSSIAAAARTWRGKCTTRRARTGPSACGAASSSPTKRGRRRIGSRLARSRALWRERAGHSRRRCLGLVLRMPAHARRRLLVGLLAGTRWCLGLVLRMRAHAR